MAMRRLKNEDLEGKTIKEVDASCVNSLHLTFEDGTGLSIWCEPAIFTPGYENIWGFFVNEKGK
jgi:hypothetical protein